MLPVRMTSGDRYLFCPYDDTHEILAKSFSAHLIKCRKNHAGHKKVTCPLDCTHKIPKPEMPYHLSTCDKRYLMDREMQKRAGDNGLKGDVIGPPIVGDHLIGQECEGGESWDDVPEGAYVTPALFNHKPSKTQEVPSYSPSGGYVPTQKEESIRKVPNAPAKAATLSNPASAQMRAPGSNQIFNYSLGLTDAGRGSRMMRMPMMNTNRPANPTLRPALGSGLSMSGVRVPGQDQGPRFIGRGISKYATKSQPIPPASSSMEQFDDTTNTDNSQIKNGQVSVQQQQNLPVQKMSEKEMRTKGEEERPLSQEELAIKQLQAGILRNQQDLIIKLKDHHTQQEQELAKKHKLQMRQLQDLQLNERQNLQKEQKRVEEEMNRALSRSLLNNPPAAPAGYQNFPPTGMLEAMRMSGGDDLSGLAAPGMRNLSNSVGPHHSETNASVEETWHENRGHNGPQSVEPVNASMSRVSIHNSNNGDDACNTPESENEVLKVRRKLEKKLKQIEILEQKSCLGHRLSAEEESKLNSKDDILANLEQLLNKS